MIDKVSAGGAAPVPFCSKHRRVIRTEEQPTSLVPKKIVTKTNNHGNYVGHLLGEGREHILTITPLPGDRFEVHIHVKGYGGKHGYKQKKPSEVANLIEEMARKSGNMSKDQAVGIGREVQAWCQSHRI